MAAPVQPVVYSIQVSGQTVKDWPKDVELRQSWGKHDLFFLRIPVNYRHVNKNKLVAWADNAPIKIVWGRGAANTTTWYGYVNHHEVTSEGDDGGTLQITYVCMGTSKPMNTEVAKAWPNTTPTLIAQALAKKYKLRCVVTSTTFQLPFEMQLESDFAFLNRIADKVGFRFWVSGGTMYFIDPAVCLSGLSNLYVPHYAINQFVTQRDTAKNFKRLKGDNIPGAVVTQRQISGIDRSTDRPFTVLADTTMPGNTTTVNTHRHVTSYQDGKQIINAQQSLSQFWLYATVEVFGFTLLYPGKVAYLGGTALPDGAAGFWIVTDAQHVLVPSGTSDTNKDFYVTRLTLMTNATGGLPKIKNTVHVTPEQVACILVGGKTWQSTNFSVVTDGVE